MFSVRISSGEDERGGDQPEVEPHLIRGSSCATQLGAGLDLVGAVDEAAVRVAEHHCCQLHSQRHQHLVWIVLVLAKIAALVC